MMLSAVNRLVRSPGPVVAVLLALALAACGEEPPPRPAPKAAAPAAPKPEAKAPAATPKPAEPAPASADRSLAERVKTALLAERGLNAHGIDVVAKDGVVTLFGTTTTRAGRDMAAKVATQVSGVKQVDNKLAVVAGS